MSWWAFKMGRMNTVLDNYATILDNWAICVDSYATR